ncbi:MAG: hypothetical protein AABX32_02865 [Nanoarchaeota archaeon]
MEFDLSKIKLSYYDIKRGLVLPSKSSEQLAEFIGILAGDGHVSFNTNKNNISITGDSRLDVEYLKYVKFLIEKLFNLKANIFIKKGQNTALIKFESKGIVDFLRNVGYYKHNSRNIEIPDWITENKNYLLSTIKGLADTDFSLMIYKNRKFYPYYPIISIGLADKEFTILISNFLAKQGFNTNLIFNDSVLDKRSGKIWSKTTLRLSGRQNLDLWMKLIGFRNQRHLNKYQGYVESGIITKSIGRPQLKIKGI